MRSGVRGLRLLRMIAGNAEKTATASRHVNAGAQLSAGLPARPGPLNQIQNGI